MPDSNSKRIAKNTGYMFIRMILVLVVGLYTSRVVLRVLGFEDFGLYNVVGSVVVFLSFLKMALTNATYRYFAFEIGTGNTKKLTDIYSMAINCHILLSLIFIVLLEIGGVWFINNKLNVNPERLFAANWVFQFSLLAFCVSVINTPFSSNIIAHEKMNFYAILSIIEVVLKLAVVYLLVICPFDRLIYYSVLQFIVALLILFCYILYCNKTFKDCKYIRIWDKQIVKDFTSYSGWSLIVNASDVVANQSMSIFFNLFLGVVANAAMGITQQVTSHIVAFLSNFTQALNPQIIKSFAAKQYDYFMKLIFTSSKVSYFLLLFICLPVIANIEFILKMWLGKYPEETPTFIRIIIWYSLFESTQNAFLQAVHATGRIKTHQILMSSLKIASIPVMYYVLWAGHPGSWMLYVWITFTFIWCTVRLIYMHFLISLPLKKYLREVLVKIVIISLVVFPITFFSVEFFNGGLVGFLVSSSVCSLLMLLLVWFYGLNDSERNIIMSFGITKKIVSFFSY